MLRGACHAGRNPRNLWYLPAVALSRTALSVSLIIGASLAVLQAAAPAGEMTISPETARLRRDRLVAELRKQLQPGESGVFYLMGAPPTDLEEFRQTSDFHYLTGLDAPGAGMLVRFGTDNDKMTEHLYLPARNRASEKWVGEAIGPGDLEGDTTAPNEERRRTIEMTGFRGAGAGDASSVGPILSMRRALSSMLARSSALFLDHEPPGLDDPETAESRLAAEVHERYPQVRILAATGGLTRLRLVKSPEEIESIRKAAAITCEGHRAAMRMLRPGMREYEIEAVLEYVFTRSGARYSSYPAIVGSGPNSCILHYFRNGRKIEPGDLVLIDAAAEYDRYAMDVTRTLPATGHFTAEQRRVYDAVLKAQREALELVRPGSTIRDIHERAQKVLDQAGLGDKFLHGCCHYVGLDVHDVGDNTTPLAPGMVLTVEPGAYLTEKGFGVRIEDTVLVTETGHEILSDCVPKDPDDVEKEMTHRVEPPTFAP